MTSQQSVNTKIIACFPSSMFFVIIKRDFITDYLNVPAFSQNFNVLHVLPSYLDVYDNSIFDFCHYTVLYLYSSATVCMTCVSYYHIWPPSAVP